MPTCSALVRHEEDALDSSREGTTNAEPSSLLALIALTNETAKRDIVEEQPMLKLYELLQQPRGTRNTKGQRERERSSKPPLLLHRRRLSLVHALRASSWIEANPRHEGRWFLRSSGLHRPSPNRISTENILTWNTPSAFTEHRPSLAFLFAFNCFHFPKKQPITGCPWHISQTRSMFPFSAENLALLTARVFQNSKTKEWRREKRDGECMPIQYIRS